MHLRANCLPSCFNHLMFKQKEIMITEVVTIYSDDQIKPNAWDPPAKCDTELMNVKVRSAFPCAFRT